MQEWQSLTKNLGADTKMVTGIVTFSFQIKLLDAVVHCFFSIVSYLLSRRLQVCTILAAKLMRELVLQKRRVKS